MQEKRLLKLADFIEKVPTRNFNLGVLVDNTRQYFIDSEELDRDMCKLVKTNFKHDCGTAGCAIGWTPAVFPRLVKWKNGNIVFRNDSNRFCDYADIAQKLFDISFAEAEYLFSPNEYPRSHKSAKYVARRIRTFVKLKKQGKTPKQLQVYESSFF